MLGLHTYKVGTAERCQQDQASRQKENREQPFERAGHTLRFEWFAFSEGPNREPPFVAIGRLFHAEGAAFSTIATAATRALFFGQWTTHANVIRSKKPGPQR